MHAKFVNVEWKCNSKSILKFVEILSEFAKFEICQLFKIEQEQSKIVQWELLENDKELGGGGQ